MSQSNRCVAIIQYRALEALPPVMSLLLSLKEMGETVFYIGVHTHTTEHFLISHSIEHAFLLSRRKSKLLRALSFYPRRLQLIHILSALERKHGAVIPWFQECHSAALAGDLARRFPKRITTFFEYECNYGSNWWGFNFEKMMREGVIVECEINRARMTQRNHHLKETPLVIANKPILPENTTYELNAEATQVFKQVGNRPVFLYQGNVAADRKDLPFVIETIAKNRPNFCVLLLPGSPSLNEALKRYPNVFTLHRITPPHHLAVTQKATVGIAVYNASGKGFAADNARFCAPNKIYEYAAFGVPTLGNRIPGLESTIGAANAGVLCDMTEESILAAVDELVQNISTYRANAKNFYCNTDTTAQINAVLERVESR